MLISMCIPCHNRAYDLKQTLPSIITSANLSPPVEIAILDYNSPDDLRDFFFKTYGEAALAEGNFLSYKRYGGKQKHYHTSHANNLSVLMSQGEYIVVGCTDMILDGAYFGTIRGLIEEENYVWMQSTGKNFVVCKRTEFIESGGFDERFEFYGPNDKDFAERLQRRGGRFTYYDGALLTVIRTPKSEKYKNYRITSRKEIGNLMKPIYLENQENEVWVVNEEGWGKWE
jgi:GT2 family glycosyltransferase